MGSKGSNETHPHFYTGSWEGFYLYQGNPEKHQMDFFLRFKEGKIKGKGGDSVGPFTWRGTYDVKGASCEMIKQYKTHSIQYTGTVDENGIWGFWKPRMKRDPKWSDEAWAKIEEKFTARQNGFHIWPLGRPTLKAALEGKAKAMKAIGEKVKVHKGVPQKKINA